MGLDLYAGTLTRYYARDWMTATQRWAEENGYGYDRIGPDGPMEQEQKPDPAQVLPAIEGWRDSLLAALKNGGTDWPAWPESIDAPYYTDKPDWDAWHALLLAAACSTCGEQLPSTVERGWYQKFGDIPVVQRASRENKGSLLAGAELWLPFPEPFWFQCPNPLGNQITISTTAGLRKELEGLNTALWQAPEEEVLSWPCTQGYPATGQVMPDGSIRHIEAPPQLDPVSLAKYAYAILWEAVTFSEEHQVPILLDY